MKQEKQEALFQVIAKAIEEFNYDTRLTLTWISEKTGIGYFVLNKLGIKESVHELNNFYYLPKQDEKRRQKKRERDKKKSPETIAKERQQTKEWYKLNKKKNYLI